jgi:pimeloyl-ACP methyl ester carboxylesterase
MSVMRLLLLTLFTVSAVNAEDSVKEISLDPIQEMSRATIYVWDHVRNPEAVLVLSPGCNGNGEHLVRQKLWQDFARQNKLGLVGLSFASDEASLKNGKGYYYASHGSGELLLDGVRRAFGKDLPLILYGFSGGAHFSSRFVEWKPERVLSWCAYSAGWWDDPQKSKILPPGIIACGDRDSRYGASMIYFKQGRALAKPWLWVSVANNGHSPHKSVDKFVREYFAVVLRKKGEINPDHEGLWVDIDRENEVDRKAEHPALTAWLPDQKLFAEWKEIHRP